MLIISMAELLVKHICTPMAFVSLHQPLHISQGVGLPLTISTPISTGLAGKLTGTGQGEELLQPRKALDYIGMQLAGTRSFTYIHAAQPAASSIQARTQTDRDFRTRADASREKGTQKTKNRAQTQS